MAGSYRGGPDHVICGDNRGRGGNFLITIVGYITSFKTAAIRAGWIQSALFFGIVLNVPVLLAARFFEFRDTGWFALEYVAAGLMAIVTPCWMAAVLVLIAGALDLVGAIARTYFVPSMTILCNLRAPAQFSLARKFSAAIVVALLVLFSLVAARVSPARLNRSEKKITACSLMLFAAFCIATQSLFVFHATGRLPIVFRQGKIDGVERQYHTGPHVVRIGALRVFNRESLHLWQEKMGGAFEAPTAATSAMGVATGAAAILEENHPPQKQNIVLVLVESWGLTRDLDVANQLTASYSNRNLRERYEVITGKVPFFGFTLSGEGRELCGDTIGPHLQFATALELSNCLPERLRVNGYRTIAAHGMNGVFFARDRWYKKIGFDEVWFHSQFQQAGLPDCIGAFIGSCDASIAAWAGDQLAARSAQPTFLYWVTLDSHLPVPIPPSVSVKADCSFAPWLASSPSACSWYQLVSNVHHSLAQIALDDLGRPTVFVIVGDHAPPFGTAGLFKHFVNTDVPYVILIPRRQGTDHGE